MPSSNEFAIGDRSIRWQRFFGPDLLAFKGHFPKTKILPGVMLIELATHVGGVFLKARHDPRRLSRIVSAVFLAPVFPGHTVTCECEFRDEAGLLTMKSVLSRDHTICANVKVTYGGAA